MPGKQFGVRGRRAVRPVRGEGRDCALPRSHDDDAVAHPSFEQCCEPIHLRLGRQLHLIAEFREIAVTWLDLLVVEPPQVAVRV